MPFEVTCEEKKEMVKAKEELWEEFTIVEGFSDKEIFHRLDPALRDIKSPTPHQVLGVKSDASRADVVRAYRALVLKWHPDKAPKGATEEQKMFEEITKKLVDAYNKLIGQ